MRGLTRRIIEYPMTMPITEKIKSFRSKVVLVLRCIIPSSCKITYTVAMMTAMI